MDPDQLMQLAVDEARRGMAAGQSPFGCAIHQRGQLLAVRHNSVVHDTDVTAHAEINALRTACAAARSFVLEGAIVATTCEPCPMCMAALHWARVDSVYYGASIADAAAAGFNELQLPARELIRLGGSSVRLVGNVQTQACRQLFDEWLRAPGRVSY